MAANAEDLSVSIDEAARVATLTIERPKKLGSLSKRLFEELIQALRMLGEDERVSCILLKSAGRAFSAGNAIVGGETPADELAREAIAAVESCPLPVVAVVQGFAYTGALELLAAVDMVIAAESTYFQDTHAALGLVPTWGGNVRLPRRLGLQQAKDLVFTCRKITAQEALAWGLVTRVVPDAALAQEAQSLAEAIAKNSRDSIAKQKRVMNEASRRPLADALEWSVREHPGHAKDMMERLKQLRSKGKAKANAKAPSRTSKL
eukprot:TRINITY_DN16099_c0_g2_i1.p1 TRINITY_DN16099_c0_g2~~TRINITY_DN16099_c0_g2_i1.p1  ORF type:complete len:263 (-),score=59.04 TRINITY_DN16099_c0_g2_i1:356-1144(-)